MDNKEFVKYFYENIVSKNELDKLSQFISKECISRSGENIVNIGLEGMKKHLEDVKKTYPDYTMKIIRQYLDGEYVVSEFIMQGTHKGEFAGIKPTDRILTLFSPLSKQKSVIYPNEIAEIQQKQTELWCMLDKIIAKFSKVK